MSYCAQADMEARFSTEELLQLTDRNNDGQVNVAVLNAVIADVDAEIDSYLGGRYQLPLVHVPVVLKRVACDLVRYYLYDDAPTDQVRQRYEDAIKFLRAAAKGDITLGLSASNEPAVTDNLAHIESAGNVFARSRHPRHRSW